MFVCVKLMHETGRKVKEEASEFEKRRALLCGHEFLLLPAPSSFSLCGFWKILSREEKSKVKTTTHSSHSISSSSSSSS